MPNNSNLHSAKNAKNNEFYTRIEDIEKELCHYTEHFTGKIIYCNCDNPAYSMFWKYFYDNFDKFGIKKLVATYYEPMFPIYTVYKYEYDGKQVIKTSINCDGDFRSQTCINIMKESDIVVSNPPFSLFREYLSCLMNYKKKFIVVGNSTAVTQKETFHYIKNNKLWLGYGGQCSMTFDNDDGVKTIFCAWYTNLDFHMRTKKFIELQKHYNPIDYPKYDNYNAINVKKKRLIFHVTTLNLWVSQ